MVTTQADVDEWLRVRLGRIYGEPIPDDWASSWRAECARLQAQDRVARGIIRDMRGAWRAEIRKAHVFLKKEVPRGRLCDAARALLNLFEEFGPKPADVIEIGEIALGLVDAPGEELVAKASLFALPSLRGSPTPTKKRKKKPKRTRLRPRLATPLGEDGADGAASVALSSPKAFAIWAFESAVPWHAPGEFVWNPPAVTYLTDHDLAIVLCAVWSNPYGHRIRAMCKREGCGVYAAFREVRREVRSARRLNGALWTCQPTTNKKKPGPTGSMSVAARSGSNKAFTQSERKKLVAEMQRHRRAKERVVLPRVAG